MEGSDGEIVMFDLQRHLDAPFLFTHEVKSVLERVLQDQPTIYEQGNDSRKEASQQEVTRVIVGRIADELGIQLEQK